MGDKTVEEYKNELMGAWALAGLGRGTRAGFFTGLALEIVAVVANPGPGTQHLGVPGMLEFLAFTTGVGAMLGTAKGLYVGAEKKAHLIEQTIRNKLEVK